MKQHKTKLDGVEATSVLNWLRNYPWFTFNSLGKKCPVIRIDFSGETIFPDQIESNEQYRKVMSRCLDFYATRGDGEVTFTIKTNAGEKTMCVNLLSFQNLNMKKKALSETAQYHNIQELDERLVLQAQKAAVKNKGFTADGWGDTKEENFDVIENALQLLKDDVDFDNAEEIIFGYGSFVSCWVGDEHYKATKDGIEKGN